MIYDSLDGVVSERRCWARNSIPVLYPKIPRPHTSPVARGDM